MHITPSLSALLTTKKVLPRSSSLEAFSLNTGVISLSPPPPPPKKKKKKNLKVKSSTHVDSARGTEQIDFVFGIARTSAPVRRPLETSLQGFEVMGSIHTVVNGFWTWRSHSKHSHGSKQINLVKCSIDLFH